MDVINVGLYGGKSIFGGKESPLEASVVSCDKSNNCSYFKSGQCWNVRGFDGRCKYGSVRNVTGYTSKAKKYHEFRRTWEKHEQHGKLKNPRRKLGLIDSVVVFPYPYASIKEDGGFVKIEVPFFSSNLSFIEYDKFTVELIRRLCTYRPHAMMGGEIKDYQTKTVPLFLAHLKEVLPDRYNELIIQYPEYSTTINHVGRKAILQTVNPSVVNYKSSGYPQFNEEWNWDGELLTYESGYVSSFNITKSYEVVEVKLKPSDKSEIVISHNDQVSENTVFVN